MPELQSPDTIAHLLVTSVGSPVRLFLVDETARIPITPYRDRTGVETTTVLLSSFNAVIKRADVDFYDRRLATSTTTTLPSPPGWHIYHRTATGFI